MCEASVECDCQPADVSAAEIRVRGLVQGVGFRPTVWRLATELGIGGEVLNDGEGVLIRAFGSNEQLTGLVTALRDRAPPLARIDGIEVVPRQDEASRVPGFRIAASASGPVMTVIVPDAATCPACLAEVFDASDRRYRYPFTNCTHCGPRLSIVTAIPYDRATTSMAAFPMCEDCRAEYTNPADRRFHAEPNACPKCGPRVWLEDGTGRETQLEDGVDAIEAAAALIRSGAIVAVKGIGGFHLACDAANADAVSRLRQRKRRFHKPFALMARDLAMIAGYADVSSEEARLLGDKAAPIVVLACRADAPPLAPELAPGQITLGFMLPYTALHHLLMQHLDCPIVLTSGNASDEPQAITNDDARRRLAGIADQWVMHDRDIVNRLDDSVVRAAAGAFSTLRRARGLAPEPLALPPGFEQAPRVLALGAELKSTFALLSGSGLIVSQHIGDLEEPATHDDFRSALALYQRLFQFRPDIVAVDAHPDYLSTQWGAALAAETGARLVTVQHHHAHVAAVLAEHRAPAGTAPVLAIVLDGLGMGSNGELWGGEIMQADYKSIVRLAAFDAVPLVGGSRAMREPWRNAFAHLNRCFGWSEISRRYADLAIVRLIGEKQPAILARMVETGLNAPPASSAGRLLDAAAALIGICSERVSYEGQAAIEMEALAGPNMAAAGTGYPVDVEVGDPPRLTWRSFWAALLDDLTQGTARGVVAARVHLGLIEALAGLARRLCREHGMTRVVLSGGVLQNRLLLEGIASRLAMYGLEAIVPQKLPASDGGIACGQAIVAALTIDQS